MSIRLFDSLAKVPAADWNALSPANFPFSDHAYLQALETSGSVGEGTGWLPLYVTSWSGERLEGALYLYLKGNSYGEYIFDWSWAHAYYERGVPYFPKLVAAVPFTPASGAKLLTHPDADAERVRIELIDTSRTLLEKTGSSSLHYLFVTKPELRLLQERGFLARHSYQFHWTNRDYRTFDDFLDSLKGRKRKQILREREPLTRSPIAIRVLEGEQLTAEHARWMHRFYSSTIEKMGAIPYLTSAFFETVFQNMRHSIVLVLAFFDENAVAGAIYYKKGDSLFGRYWGCDEQTRNLHFELCYYRGIEYAISRGLRLFEAGAQGEHKVARGFLPQLTFSAHWLQHPWLRAAVADFIEREKQEIVDTFEQWAPHSPYHAGSN